MNQVDQMDIAADQGKMYGISSQKFMLKRQTGLPRLIISGKLFFSHK